MTTLLAPCDLSHISGMTWQVLPRYWHCVAFPTKVAWYGQYYHITGTVWHFPHKWHDTASITTLLALVAFSTLVAWHGKYYLITGTVWHFPHEWHDTASITTLLAPCGISHISGMIRPVWPHYWHRVTFPTLVAWNSQYYHITGTVWLFPH